MAGGLMRVIFMGSPDFSVGVLEAIVAGGHEVACVYAQPPRRAGRGKVERKTPVHARAEDLGLEVRTPLNFKDPVEVDAFAALNADVAVVVAYGLILPQAVLDAPKRGCLNIHASLLPRWRGAAPIQRAIMAGDATTGVCIMQMEAGLDTGPVLLREEVEISGGTTAGSLHDALSKVGAEAIVTALANLDRLSAEPQPETGVTYAQKIDKAEARINWSEPAVQIDRQIRGLSPFPGAWAEFEGERVKFLLSEVVDGSGDPGEVVGEDLTLGAGKGAVRILKLQRAGKSAAETREVLRGWRLKTGDRFT